jgi:hypothetical protein
MFHPTPRQSLTAMRTAALLYEQRCREKERVRYWRFDNASASSARLEGVEIADQRLLRLVDVRAFDLVSIPFIPSHLAWQVQTVRARRRRRKHNY